MRTVRSLDLETFRSRARAETNLPPIIYGQAISLFGDYIAYFTLPLFVVSLTASAADLGLTAAAETIPMLLFGFAAGVFLDRRSNLRLTLIAADAARALAFIALAVGAFTGVATPYMVFGAAFIVGTMGVVFDSGLQAMLPGVLDEDMLLTANSRLQLARTLAMTLGPATGGLLVALAGGFGTAFLVNSSTFIISALFLMTIRRVRERVPAVHQKLRTAVGEGLRFLIGDPHLRWATLGGTVTNLVFAPLEALLVLFVAERLHPPQVGGVLEWAFSEEAGIGLFFALQAAIGSIGVAVAPRVARHLRLGRMYVAGLAMLGGGFAVVAFSSSYLAVIPSGLALAGVGWVNVALSTMRQRLTPKELLGRVIAASRTLAWAGLPLGAAVGGALAESFGLVPVYLAGSGAVLIVAVALRATALWHVPILEDDPEPQSHSRPTRVGPAPPARDRTRLAALVDRPTAPVRLGAFERRLLLAGSLALGSLFVLGAESLEAIDPLLVGFGSVAIAVIAATALAETRNPIERRSWPAIAALGIGWIAAPTAMTMIAIDRMDSSTVALAAATVPALIVLGFGAVRRALAIKAVAGIGLAAVGILLVFTEVDQVGMALAVGAAALVAAGYLAFLPLRHRFGPAPVLWRAGLVAAAVLLPFGIVGVGATGYRLSSIGAVLAIGVLGAVAAASLTALAGRIGLAGPTTVLYFVPVVAVILGAVLRGEQLSIVVVTGLALVLLGAFFASQPPEEEFG